jgi:hypothetical protein
MTIRGFGDSTIEKVLRISLYTSLVHVDVLVRTMPRLRRPTNQQNQVYPYRAVQSCTETIEPQRLQKGFILYSTVQLPAMSAQLCGSLSDAVEVCTE